LWGIVGIMNKYNTISRIRRLVSEYFEGNKHKIDSWFTLRNPNLGNVSPLTMISLGNEEKLLKWVQYRIDENQKFEEFKKVGRK
jgi:hypothetical protein